MTVKRVLHVYSGNLFGGIERMLLTFAEVNGTASIEHEFALSFPGELSRRLEDIPAPIHIVGAARLSRPLSVFRAQSRLRKLLSQARYDAVVCHSAWAQAIFGS